MPFPIVTSAERSRLVMSEGRSAVVAAYGHMTYRPNSWNETATRICWRPPITRLRTKSRTARVSGAAKAARPRYFEEDGVPLEPEPPQRYPKLRFRSVPTEPSPFAWRFLRQLRSVPDP